MIIDSFNDLNNENLYKIKEDKLIEFGYYTDFDNLSDSNSTTILQKVYKKSSKNEQYAPKIITFLNGFILSKIWIKNGKIDRQDGSPAEILYDEDGISEKNWYVSGRCINDEISFLCIKNKKERKEVTKDDIEYIKAFFKIK